MDSTLFLCISFHPVVVPRFLVAPSSVETLRLLLALGVPQSSLSWVLPPTPTVGQEAINILIQLTSQHVEGAEKSHVLSKMPLWLIIPNSFGYPNTVNSSVIPSLQHFPKSVRKHQAPALLLFPCPESPERESRRQDVPGREWREGWGKPSLTPYFLVTSCPPPPLLSLPGIPRKVTAFSLQPLTCPAFWPSLNSSDPRQPLGDHVTGLSPPQHAP